MNRRFIVVSLTTVLALALAACGGTKDTGFSDLPTPKGTGGDGGAKEIQLVAGNKFIPATFEAKAGTAVVWHNNDSSGQPHNVQSDTNLFDSHPNCLKDQTKCMPLRDTFSFTFKDPGEYRYYCVIHGTKGGVGMAGVVKVT